VAVTKWDYMVITSSLDGFLQELERISRFDDRIRGIRQLLEDEAQRMDAEAQRLIDAANRATASTTSAEGCGPYFATRAAEAASTAAAQVTQAQDLRKEADKRRAESNEWEEQRLRVYVLRLVTAFEVYLRDFIIEKACSDDGLVLRFLDSRLGLSVGSPLDLGGPSEKAERLAACVDETLLMFSNPGQASTFYAQWFGEKKGFLSDKKEMLAPPLGTATEKKAAIADVRILFQLRHILVHKSGVPNAKYHSELTGEECRPRLHPMAFESPERARPPEGVLASPAIGPRNATKLEDLYESLMNLARHIDAAYYF
jgi:hypothetical protein